MAVDVLSAPAMDKAALRRRLEARRQALSPADRARIEAAVYAQLFRLPAWHAAPVIGGYVAARGELDLSPVWRAAIEAGKTYALPVTETGAREGRMRFRGLSTYCPASLVPGRFGIAEPPDHPACPPLAPADLEGALILVPGLGFDADGYRIGYGGGYYDRFLHSLADAGIHVTTVALTPAVCRIDRLPREPHDCAVDIILDERSDPYDPL